MADYSFAFLYDASVTVTGGIVTVLNSVSSPTPGPATFTDLGALEVGNNISVSVPDPEVPGEFIITSYTYRGFADLGGGESAIIVQGRGLDSGSFYLLANTGGVVVTEPIAVTTDQPFPYCLLAGTMLLTPSGERPVEDIRPGDEVLTADGEAVTVRWVGRQSLISMFAARALPIVIHAGALADNVPSRDLHVSPDHAILLDGYLVCAQALVNGTTITVMGNPPAQLDYYHLELDTQRIIIADGTPVESFVDNVTRAGFDNYHEWVALGLEPQPVQELELPRVKSARQLPTPVRERLDAREALPA